MNTAEIPAKQGPDRGSLIFILITAFLNLAGIGLIGPVSPFLVASYTTSADDLALANGLLFTSYSLFQFLALPALGALSDRFGRRPLLLICLLGSAVGYFMFGVGGALWVLFAGRIIDGITGGNLGIIYAYIADLTTPEERTRYYGLIGAVSGFGFVVGPAVGGILARIGGNNAPVFFAAAVTLANVIWGWFAMPESLPMNRRPEAIAVRQLNPFGQLLSIFRIPQLRLLLLASFFAVTPFAALQSNLSVLARDFLAAEASDVAVVFTIIGIVGIIVQGGLIRPLLKRFGEVRLAIVGALLMSISFVMVGFLPSTPVSALIFVSAAIFATGNGLFTPSLTGLISQAVGPREQGRIQGGSQSVQALARVIGPVIGSSAYVSIGAFAPYWGGAVLFGVTIVCIIAAIPVIRAARQT